MSRVSLGIALCLIFAACQTGELPGRAISRVDNARMTETEVRAELQDYVRRFAARVETAADHIIATVDTAKDRRRALLWKMNAIPACQSAAFNSDPVIGLSDVWALTIQMRDFFDVVDDQKRGEAWSVAHAACLDAQADAERIILELTGSPERLEELRTAVEAWAVKNPLGGWSFSRPSVLRYWATIRGEKRLGAIQAVQSMEAGIHDIADHMTLYVETMPRQARWQTEYLLEGLSDRPEYVELMARLDSFDATLKEMTEFLLGVDALIVRERELVTELVDRQRESVISEADRLRLATLADVRVMVDDLVKEVEILRDETMATTTELMGEERGIVLAAITAERVAALTELEVMRCETMVEARAMASDILDESLDKVGARMKWVLLYGGVFGLACLVILGAGGLFIYRAIRRLEVPA